jgi:protein involved in polysaccharide export with SLBB domain
MTVLDAIGAAGGFRDFATGVRVTHADGTSDFYKYLRIIDEGLEQPLLRPGDSLSVPRRFF